jgi:hypothetical protein
MREWPRTDVRVRFCAAHFSFGAILILKMNMNEPKSIRAGDTVKWNEEYGNYLPSDGWTMKYNLSGSQALTVSAVPASGMYSVTMTVAQTSPLAAGYYTLAKVVERGSGATLERVTVSSTSIVVLQNLSTPFEGDTRTHLQRVLDSIKAVIEKRATQAEEEITINGRSLRRTPHAELLKLYKNYEYLVEVEKRREDIANGLPSGGVVLTHFR